MLWERKETCPSLILWLMVDCEIKLKEAIAENLGHESRPVVSRISSGDIYAYLGIQKVFIPSILASIFIVYM